MYIYIERESLKSIGVPDNKKLKEILIKHNKE